MTRLVVRDEVCRAFPGLRIIAIVALGFDGHRPWPDVAAGLAALEVSAGAGLTGDPAPATEEDPHIAAWHAAYRAFGTNPRRNRPSADALRRRLSRSGKLPRINPAVDGYNLVSARYGVPAGAFDLSQVRGDITIGFADGSEEFTPLGEPGAVEHPHPGEVIYADAAGVLTRHWNHRDADRTKVTEDSEQIVFLLETVDAGAFGARLDDARRTLIRLLADRSAAILWHEISASDPEILALVPERESGAGVDVDLRSGA
ncbi:MAG TPA: phenylalanine--tRNA ligase beta subunit-related protein [Streptosporangiaceae bacterium]|nr:phenylalanine--tRNA ligase beta subunit-related protein [Streptosporangiaceae bacterium]